MLQPLKTRHNEGAVTAPLTPDIYGNARLLPPAHHPGHPGARLSGRRLIRTNPWLVTLSRHKGWVFAVSALVLVVGG